MYPSQVGRGVGSAGDNIVNADTNTVLFVYPDYNASHPKIRGVEPAPSATYALYYEAVGIVFAAANNAQIETTDTGSYIDSTTGIPKPTFPGAIVLVGDPGINEAVSGYEASSQAPIKLDQTDGRQSYFEFSNGTRIYNSGMVSSPGSPKQDVFVIESFLDSYGRHVYILYGYGAMGTLAAAIYYKSVILPNAAAAKRNYYIVKWTDANANGFPDPGDTYTLLLGSSPLSEGPAFDLPVKDIVYLYVTAVVLALLGTVVTRGWVKVVIEKEP